MKSQAAKQYLEERYEVGRRCFDDLSQEEREVATGHIIASEGAMEVCEVMSEGDCDMLGLLSGAYFKTHSQEDSEKFWKAFGKDVSARYENRINELLEKIHLEWLDENVYNKPFVKDEPYYQQLLAA